VSISYSTMVVTSGAGTGYRGRRGRDRMVVGFTTTCAFSAYHH